jgi:hypothetical protein
MINTDRQIIADWVDKNTSPEFIEDFINSSPIVTKEFLIETMIEANVLQEIINSNNNIVIMVHRMISHVLNTNDSQYIFHLTVEDVLENKIFIKKIITK